LRGTTFGERINRSALRPLVEISRNLNLAPANGLFFGYRVGGQVKKIEKWTPSIIRDLCERLNINLNRFRQAFGLLPAILAVQKVKGAFAVEEVVRSFNPETPLLDAIRYVNRPSRSKPSGNFLPVDEQMTLIERGVAAVTPREEMLDKLAENRPLNIKLGVDPTSPDIHLGHTVVFRKLQHFQRLGHRVVFLIGDLTATIGDPTGRSATRKPLTREQVLANAQTYLDQVARLLDVERTEVVFNSSWLGDLRFTEILALASTFTVARIMDRNDFSDRFRSGSPIAFHEFLYPLMQAYDSIAIEADVELGGTDQLFNLAFGRDLQRAIGQPQQVLITLPILPGLDGKEKMSKSMGNSVGITEPPSDMFGKIMSISDNLILPYAELLTDLPLNALRELLASGDNAMRVKKDVAEAVVASFYGADQAKAAKEEFEARFSRRELPVDMPVVSVSVGSLTAGKIGIIDLLLYAQLVKSKGEARRLISQSGVRINQEKVSNVTAMIEIPVDGLVLQVGKLRFAKIVLA
ncbi:MAG: tyrosine--tRNA ligase, partial [Candidatus Margulisbacteria bacterium]|nr:tyrosine--tRNA ligase [Candidatus Margulisiibacteriota bacterium]